MFIDDRIVIMTSNYPERLDKALIRPGRVDLQQDFNYCSYPQIEKMIQLHFPEVASETLQILSTKLSSDDSYLSPAKLQNLLMTADKAEDLCFNKIELCFNSPQQPI